MASVGKRNTVKISLEAMSRISKSPSLQPTAIAFPVEQKLTAIGIDVPDPVKSDELFERTFSLHVLH
jgi:kynurenine formamidase